MRAALVLLAACASAAPHEAPSNRAVASHPVPCDMIEAMLAIDNAGFQRMYEGMPHVIDVRAPASLLPPGTRCLGRRFILLSQQPDIEGPIIQLQVTRADDVWNFSAHHVEANYVEYPDGSFDVTTSYNHAIGGFIEWKDGRWRTWEDFDRIMRRPK